MFFLLPAIASVVSTGAGLAGAAATTAAAAVTSSGAATLAAAAGAGYALSSACGGGVAVLESSRVLVCPVKSSAVSLRQHTPRATKKHGGL